MCGRSPAHRLTWRQRGFAACGNGCRWNEPRRSAWWSSNFHGLKYQRPKFEEQSAGNQTEPKQTLDLMYLGSRRSGFRSISSIVRGHHAMNCSPRSLAIRLRLRRWREATVVLKRDALNTHDLVLLVVDCAHAAPSVAA